MCIILPLPWLYKIKTFSQSYCIKFCRFRKLSNALEDHDNIFIGSSDMREKKKKNWREIRIVFSGNYILSGFLALVLQNKENYHEKYNKPRMNSENKQILIFSHICFRSSLKLKDDNYKFLSCFSQIHVLSCSPDTNLMTISVSFQSMYLIFYYTQCIVS